MPPGIPGGWDDLDVWTQSKLIAYDQTRCYDETPQAPKSSPPPKPSSRSRRRRR